MPLDTDAIHVQVHLFGIFRELAGADVRRIRLPSGGRVRDLVATLRGEGGMDFLPAAPTVAVNREYASPEQQLETGDEVALIPPIAGG